MKLHKQLHWVLYVFFFLGSCARQTSPTGGPKDTIPPKLISSIPVKEQKNYKSQQLELSFDEWIVLNNPKDKIIIVPDVNKKYEVSAKKTKVILTFDEPLKDTTTYSINFREAIQDITEKNPAVNLKLAFSTGPYIDSLSISGTVYDPLKGKEYKDATIALYQSDTFNIFKHRPIYLTKSDEKGRYIIENLKPGVYHIYAIEDKNRNLFADSKNESYGYLVDSIALTSNRKNVSIPLVRLDSRGIKLTSGRPYNTYYNIKVTKSLKSYTLKSPGEVIISAFGEDLANVRVYNTFENKDSVQVHFTALDSVDNKIDTTLYVKFSKREVKPDKFEVKPQNFELIGDKGLLRGKVTYTKPLLDIRFDSLYYRIDSTNVIHFTMDDIKIDSANKSLTITKKIDKALLIKPEPDKKAVPNQKPLPPAPAPQQPKLAAPPTEEKPKAAKKPPVENQLYMGKSTFVSIEQDSSAAATQNLKPTKLEETGVIIVNIKTTETRYIVQLLDKSFNVIREEKNNIKIQFEDLQPGEYMIRTILDRNGNGVWDPGNFFKHEEPEKLVYYRNEKQKPEINLKANWEIGPLLITF